MQTPALKSKALIIVEIVSDFFMFLIKMALGIMSGSSTMIAEGFHSFTDTGNQIFLAIGMQTSKKKPDKLHPFGYGKERFFWALLSALFIAFVSGVLSIWQGIEKIYTHSEITHFQTNFIVLGIALLLSFINFFLSTRHIQPLFGKKLFGGDFLHRLGNIKRPIALNLWFGDMAAIAGNLIALFTLILVYFTSNSVYDGIASIFIGCILLFLGIYLANDSKDLLIGEAVSPEVFQKLCEVVHAFPKVKRVLTLKTMHLSHDEVLINIDISFQENLKTKELEQVVDEIEKKIQEIIPTARHIFIEAEDDR